MTRAFRAARPTQEEGQSLVELLIALTVLTVAILALVAAYSSGYVALTRATRLSSASLLADSRMERYRALKYANIYLNPSGEDATYTADAAYSSAAEVTGCSTTPTPVSCTPTVTATGPDGRSYRLDTYIRWSCMSGTLDTSSSPPTCGSGNPAPVKIVTVVVRKSSSTGDWVREQSTFSLLTGS